ncbi:Protein FIG-1 a [Aphelenchoides avenae]|nr:Protein FIG-1 a [Aphelenchus avenae]
MRRITLLLAVLLTVAEGQDSIPCQPVGEWDAWQEWTACRAVSRTSSTTLRRRLRSCEPLPAGCTSAESTYNCEGPYSQVELCGDTTTPQTTTGTSLSTTTRPKTTSTISTTTTTIDQTTKSSLGTTTTLSAPLSTPSASTTTEPPSATSILSTTVPPSPPSTTATSNTVASSSTIFTEGSVPAETEPTPTEPSAGAANCAGTQWNEWMAWSTCTDTCGACGRQQRLRYCSKTNAACECPGDTNEEAVCNVDVCKYPRPGPCCGSYEPSSVESRFVCALPTATGE